MELQRRSVLSVMRRVGLHDRIREAEQRLPDPVDVDRDAALLAGLGLELNQLMDRLGSSP